ncbi:MAG: Lrp/AsnC family transcriptional regulator [Coriobacteriia bacterium]|nr:Lrp/AsnC family transcriptional regulator [Coriobacteriia bacterium]
MNREHTAITQLTELQKELLSVIQSGFPVSQRPYGELAEKLGITENEAYASIDELRKGGVIRRLGAIFDSYKLGYRSTLCAIAVPNEQVEEVAAHISSYPNVTHNYLRENRYNVWFTLIAPSEQRIEEILAEIAESTSIDDILNLPAIRLFKIRVDFDFTGKRSVREEKLPVLKPALSAAIKATEEEKALVRLLQADLPAGLTPYKELAQKLTEQGFSCDEAWVLKTTETWVNERVIRRLGAAIKHHKTGFTCNAMGTWTVPEEKLDELGPIMASFKEVSHCYQRPSTPTWTANTYTMIHGKSKDECEAVAQRIQEATGLDAPVLLYSTKEFKKTSMSYFAEEL